MLEDGSLLAQKGAKAFNESKIKLERIILRKKIIEEAPHLLAEWMTEKNDRPIEDITAGSSYKAWWKCKECDHQWKTAVSLRVKGRGCPSCAGHHGIPLLEEAPHLEEEWMTEKNDRPIEDITSGSNYRAWWKCKECGHQWETYIGNRIKGYGCPCCAGRHDTPLLSRAPHLEEEWMTEKNDRPIEDITSGSPYKAWWKCKSCNHQWQAPVQTRAERGTGCLPCSFSKKKRRPYIVDEYPHLVDEWLTEKNDRPIEDITAGSGYKAWWKCKECDHQWNVSVAIRVKGSGCPSCAGRHGTPLLKVAHHLKDEWVTEKNDRAIEDITTGSGYRAWWKCKKCDHQWKAEVKSRAKGSGCVMCGGHHGTSLLAASPHLKDEWVTEKNDRAIEDITAGSRYRACWKCKKCDHQWKCRVESRTKGSGCPSCAGYHGRSLSVHSPSLAKEWVTEKNDRKIDEITMGSNYKAWWECKSCNNQWQAIVQNRVKGTRCPKCARSSKKTH